LFGGGGASETITFEVVGMTATSVMGSGGPVSGLYAPVGAFPADMSPVTSSIVVDIDEAQLPELRRQIARVLGAFMLETGVFTRLISGLLNTFIAFPTMVAALGLVVGGVVIANSVALTTMERRREIAVMKAVGLQRERVLFMLLLENGVLGLIGGLLGIGIGFVALVIMVARLSIPGSELPWGTALVLMALCIAVALIAALSSAWGASGEKPLNVLRYE
jgi:ABC-type antimicrobial peptide transport system permease subunit